MLAAVATAGPCLAQGDRTWPPNSMDRPRPPVISAPAGTAGLVPPPSDAVVLFDGKSAAAWQTDSGAPVKWTLRGGYLEVAPGAGTIRTRRSFGSVQLHVEWASPVPAEGESQERGNSGVFLMGRYEIQVLDTYHNLTYADGMAGAVYGQTPPLVNASRAPGQWQTYDMVFHRPRFDARGNVTRPARVTVLHNGVLVQDNTAITGWTVHGEIAKYQPHADRLPLALQDHGRKVRYRNIWLRELADTD